MNITNIICRPKGATMHAATSEGDDMMARLDMIEMQAAQEE